MKTIARMKKLGSILAKKTLLLSFLVAVTVAIYNGTNTVVVVLNPTVSAQAQTIAQLLGGTVGTLPQGEVRPAADIVVIVGK